jgi:hypothetical protein
MDTKQYPVTRTDAEWRKLLTPEQYEIMREHGTEAPGSCALNFEKRAGTFICAGVRPAAVRVEGGNSKAAPAGRASMIPRPVRWRPRRTKATV